MPWICPRTFLPATLGVATLLVAAGPADAQFAEPPSVESRTAQQASQVLSELGSLRMQAIPETLLSTAEGLVIIPGVVRGAFVVGIQHGRGVVLARDAQGQWLPPQFVSITGGSVGWQAGLQSTDLVLVFQTRKSVENLLTGKFTVGVDAAAAAGPIGRRASAATDLPMQAEILSYSRSRGLFAGVSIDGSNLAIDAAAAARYYGPTPGTLPPSAATLLSQVTALTADRVLPPTIEAWPSPPLGVAPAAAQVIVPDAAPSLAATAQRLAAQLDPAWQSFLQIGRLASPAEASLMSTAEWSELGQRFDRVAAEPAYAALAQQADFQQLRDRVHQRRQAQPSPPPAAALPLPPPPRR